MLDMFAYHKNKLNRTLEPIIQLLEFKKTKLPLTDWIRFFETTKSSILKNPEQYLDKELPEKAVIHQAVEEIFAEIFAGESVTA